MKPYHKTLENCPLFFGIDFSKLSPLLAGLGAKEREMKKDDILLAARETPRYIGVVLAGSVYVSQEDYWGNRVILAAVGEGELFAEAFCCARAEVLPVSVTAGQEGRVLLLDGGRILSGQGIPQELHTVLTGNLMRILASKNIALTGKIRHITKKTTREKVLSYLSGCAVAAGRDLFTIPFNRQEMADYLSVERSALSATLCKMRDEGILTFHKSTFRLLPNGR